MKPPFVLIHEGFKGNACSRTTGASRKENITCLEAVNAAGQKAPPLIIFKGNHVRRSWVPDTQEGEYEYPNTAMQLVKMNGSPAKSEENLASM